MLLASCASCPPPEVQTRTVTVEVPVVRKYPPAALADCPPDVPLPATGPLPVGALAASAEALGRALAACRGRLAALRAEDEPGRAPGGANGAP